MKKFNLAVIAVLAVLSALMVCHESNTTLVIWAVAAVATAMLSAIEGYKAPTTNKFWSLIAAIAIIGALIALLFTQKKSIMDVAAVAGSFILPVITSWVGVGCLKIIDLLDDWRWHRLWHRSTI